MQCTSRLGVDEMEHLQERYERAEARIEEAKDRYDRMRAVGRMYEMSWKNPYAAFRAGEISELGLFGRTSDHLEAANMYMRAHRLGDTRATWRLISEHPCSADPEEADARSERLFMEAALPVRTRRADGSWLFEQDDGFMEEAESRADGSAWVRRMLAHAKHLAGDSGCRHWAELSARDGDAASRRILAEWLIDDAYQAEDPDDGRRSFAEAMAILNSLDDDWRAHLIMGRETFCSRFAARDDAVAIDHFLRAVSLTGDPDGRSVVLPYLEYYAASSEGLGPETRCLTRSGRASHPGPSPPIQCPSLGWSAVPEWALLLSVTRTAPDGTTGMRGHCNSRGGFEDGMFSIVPAVSDPHLPDRPASFYFKPTGLRIDLGDDVMSMTAVREELDESDLRWVFLLCVDSVRRSIGGDAE